MLRDPGPPTRRHDVRSRIDRNRCAANAKQIIARWVVELVRDGNPQAYSVTGCGTDFLQWKWAEMDRAAREVAA